MKSCAKAIVAGFFDLRVGRVGFAVSDVVTDGVVEQHGLLCDERDLRAQARELHIAKIDAVPEHRAGTRIVKTRQQLRQRRFAAARLADQRHHRPGFDRQVYVAQHRPRFVLITERDVAQLDLVFQRRRARGVFLLLDLGVLVHHFPNVMRCGERLLHAVLQSRQLAHRIVTAKQKNEERQELRGRSCARPRSRADRRRGGERRTEIPIISIDRRRSARDAPLRRFALTIRLATP